MKIAISILSILLLATIIYIVFDNSSIFDKQRACYQDSGGSEFAFYSPKLDACIEYLCIYEGSVSDWISPPQNVPGCEIIDYYSEKLHRSFSCVGESDCQDKLGKYK